MDPNNLIAWNNRAYIHNKLQKYDKAIEDSTKAITMDPHYANAYAHRALAFLALGYPDKAEADCIKATKLNPKYERAYFARLVVFFTFLILAEVECIRQRENIKKRSPVTTTF
jgi:tetratricopeptide (TPR) repeat protein